MKDSIFNDIAGKKMPHLREDEFSVHYDRFASEILDEGALSCKDKLLILLGVYASKGSIGFIKEFLIQRLRQLNVPAEEVLEVLKAVTLSRGPIPLIDGLEIIESMGGDDLVRKMKKASVVKSSGEILDYFQNRFNAIPEWIALLGKEYPSLLEQYYCIRSNCLEDGAAPRKVKELILVAVNAAGLYHEGMRLHMIGALQAGGKREEIIEALLVSVLGGGIVSWIDGLSVMKEIEVLRQMEG